MIHLDMAYSLAENDILMSKETVIHLDMAYSFTKLEKRESFCRYLCQNLDGNQEQQPFQTSFFLMEWLLQNALFNTSQALFYVTLFNFESQMFHYQY